MNVTGVRIFEQYIGVYQSRVTGGGVWFIEHFICPIVCLIDCRASDVQVLTVTDCHPPGAIISDVGIIVLWVSRGVY